MEAINRNKEPRGKQMRSLILIFMAKMLAETMIMLNVLVFYSDIDQGKAQEFTKETKDILDGLNENFKNMRLDVVGPVKEPDTAKKPGTAKKKPTAGIQILLSSSEDGKEEAFYDSSPCSANVHVEVIESSNLSEMAHRVLIGTLSNSFGAKKFPDLKTRNPEEMKKFAEHLEEESQKNWKQCLSGQVKGEQKKSGGIMDKIRSMFTKGKKPNDAPAGTTAGTQEQKKITTETKASEKKPPAGNPDTSTPITGSSPDDLKNKVGKLKNEVEDLEVEINARKKKEEEEKKRKEREAEAKAASKRATSIDTSRIAEELKNTKKSIGKVEDIITNPSPEEASTGKTEPIASSDENDEGDEDVGKEAEDEGDEESEVEKASPRKKKRSLGFLGRLRGKGKKGEKKKVSEEAGQKKTGKLVRLYKKLKWPLKRKRSRREVADTPDEEQ